MASIANQCKHCTCLVEDLVKHETRCQNAEEWERQVWMTSGRWPARRARGAFVAKAEGGQRRVNKSGRSNE